MANPPRLKSVTRPSRDFRERLEGRAGITHWADDSVAKNFSDTLASAILADRNQMVSAFEQIQISSASGKALSSLATTHGLARIQPTRAYSIVQENSFHFFTSGQTFGDINGGAAISIPAGTIIRPTSKGRSQIEYIVKYDYTLAAGASKMFCAVEAVGMGSGQNVGPRSLNSHGLKASLPNLLCTNNYAIVNGRDVESDDELRFRLTSYFKSLTVNNYHNLRMLSLSVPGVLEVTPIEGYYGMGTCGVFVFGADGFSSPQLVRQVQSKLNAINTPGLKVIASAGVQVSFSFDMELAIPFQPTLAQQNRIKAGIKKSIRDYLSTSTVRKRVSLLELRRKIMSEVVEFNSIIPKRSATKEQLFSNTYVSRKYANYRTGSERERILTNSYELSREEYAVLGAANISFEVVA